MLEIINSGATTPRIYVFFFMSDITTSAQKHYGNNGNNQSDENYHKK